jgi:nucleoid DNA-binding protein
MTKTELISKLYTETGITRSDLGEMLDALATVVAASLKQMPAGERLLIPGVVALKLRTMPARKARLGRNPATGETVRIPAKPAHAAVKAYVPKALKDAVLGKKR